MNISSIVIRCKSDDYEDVVEWCKESELCDFHFGDKEKGVVIVTIEGEDIAEEISKLTDIQAMPKVISAEMMMAYQEEQLDEEIRKLEEANPVPEWMNDPNIRAEDIVYRGDLRKKDLIEMGKKSK